MIKLLFWIETETYKLYNITKHKNVQHMTTCPDLTFMNNTFILKARVQGKMHLHYIIGFSLSEKEYKDVTGAVPQKEVQVS